MSRRNKNRIRMLGTAPESNTNGNQSNVQSSASAPVIESPEISPSDAPTGMMSQQDYLKERALLVDLNKANTDQHDKAILQLTAGTLALSITFVAQIAKSPAQWTVILLGLGWCALIISIVAMLSSFLTGSWACNRQLKLLDQHFNEARRPSQDNVWRTITTCLNLGSFAMFVIGIIFVSLFSWCNLPTLPANTPQQQRASEVPAGKPPEDKPLVLSTGQPLSHNGISDSKVAPSSLSVQSPPKPLSHKDDSMADKTSKPSTQPGIVKAVPPDNGVFQFGHSPPSAPMIIPQTQIQKPPQNPSQVKK